MMTSASASSAHATGEVAVQGSAQASLTVPDARHLSNLRHRLRMLLAATVMGLVAIAYSTSAVTAEVQAMWRSLQATFSGSTLGLFSAYLGTILLVVAHIGARNKYMRQLVATSASAQSEEEHYVALPVLARLKEGITTAKWILRVGWAVLCTSVWLLAPEAEQWQRLTEFLAFTVMAYLFIKGTGRWMPTLTLPERDLDARVTQQIQLDLVAHIDW